MSLESEAGRIRRRLRQLRELLHMADETIEEVQGDFTTYQGDVSAKMAALEAEVANSGGVPTAVQAKIDDLGTAIRAADAALTATGETSGAPGTTPSASTSPATDPNAISPNPGVVPAQPETVLPDVAGDGVTHEDGSVAPPADAVQPAQGTTEVA